MQYAVPVSVQKGSILDITDSEIQFTINVQYFLETLLMEIRSKTISYASYLKKAKDKKKKKEKGLLGQLLELQKEFEKHKDKINEKKKELENIRNDMVMGSLVLSCFKWINDGEKPTDYFLNLKIITTLVKSLQR